MRTHLVNVCLELTGPVSYWPTDVTAVTGQSGRWSDPGGQRLDTRTVRNKHRRPLLVTNVMDYWFLHGGSWLNCLEDATYPGVVLLSYLISCYNKTTHVCACINMSVCINYLCLCIPSVMCVFSWSVGVMCFMCRYLACKSACVNTTILYTLTNHYQVCAMCMYQEIWTKLSISQ